MSLHRVLIVGEPGEVHVGRHLRVAAEHLGVPVEFADVSAAYGGGKLLRKLLWLWDRQPCFFHHFSRRVVTACEAFRPTVVIASGTCPLDSKALIAIQKLGAWVVNYSTDDPFNPVHRAKWFLQVLPMYDAVFTTRRANYDDLVGADCKAVHYLPFAYAPDQHYREAGAVNDSSDMAFVGGADADRIALISPLIKSGIRMALYGGYWDRYDVTRSAHRGFAGADGIRRVTASARLYLVLVRRANRDGHVMRSFEAAACGGCLLVEDTAEHREIFADTVAYFTTPDELIIEANALLADPERRRRSADASYYRVAIAGRNTYSDRLQSILEGKGRS